MSRLSHYKPHHELHRTQHVGWLRAAVLGANDGIVSTASLMLGVAAAQTSHTQVLVAGAAGLVAGAMSMAAGEYVSVSSQRDTEQADIERERRELAANEAFERDELATIYIARGLDRALAQQVAEQLMQHDALGAHTRDELGISEAASAKPLQAALASALSFAIGAALPLLVVVLLPLIPFLGNDMRIPVAAGSLVCLAALGALAASAGGAGVAKAALRVTFWGALAMALTSAIGSVFGAVI